MNPFLKFDHLKSAMTNGWACVKFNKCFDCKSTWKKWKRRKRRRKDSKRIESFCDMFICTFHFHPPNFMFTEKYQYSISLNDIVARTSLAAGTYHTWKKKNFGNFICIWVACTVIYFAILVNYLLFSMGRINSFKMCFMWKDFGSINRYKLGISMNLYDLFT